MSRDVADGLLHQRYDERAPVGVHLGALAGGLRGDGLHVVLRLGERDTRLEASDGLIVASVARGLRRIDPHRRVEIGAGGGEVERLRHHADDFGRASLQIDFPSQDVGPAAEAALPEAIAQHGNARRAGHIVGGRDGAPDAAAQFAESRRIPR